RFHLLHVLEVVVPKHDDLFGIGDTGTELRLIFTNEIDLRFVFGSRLVDHRLQPLRVALKDLVDGGGDRPVVRGGGLLDVQNPEAGFDAPEVLAALAKGAERHLSGKLAVGGPVPWVRGLGHGLRAGRANGTARDAGRTRRASPLAEVFWGRRPVL